MGQIIVNGNPFVPSSGLQDDLTLGDLAKRILSEFHESQNQNGIITQIIVDGKTHIEFYDSPLSRTNAGIFQNIDFTIKGPIELALEAINSSPIYIDEIKDKISRIIDLYKESNVAEMQANFLELIELLDLFIQLLNQFYQLKSAMQSPNTAQSLKAPIEIHIENDLLSSLNSLWKAKKDNDWVLVCDLLEYEISRILNEWKIQVFPKLKRELEEIS